MSDYNLIKWIIRWCARPAMFLAGPSDNGEPDISNVWLLVHGYLCGAEPLVNTEPGESAAEWIRFRRWLEEQRPRYVREGTAWLGDVILEEAGGDHWKAAEEFKCLAEQYLRTQGVEPG